MTIESYYDWKRKETVVTLRYTDSDFVLMDNERYRAFKFLSALVNVIFPQKKKQLTRGI